MNEKQNEATREEILHRADCFESMAFALAEELRTAREIIKMSDLACMGCLRFDGDGKECGKCVRGSKFIWSHLAASRHISKPEDEDFGAGIPDPLEAVEEGDEIFFSWWDEEYGIARVETSEVFAVCSKGVFTCGGEEFFEWGDPELFLTRNGAEVRAKELEALHDGK